MTCKCIVSTKIRAQGQSPGYMTSASMCFLKKKKQKQVLPVLFV